MSAHIDKPGYELNRPRQQTFDHYSALRRICSSLKRMIARRRQRLTLSRLDDRLLADIGITREQAIAEFSKPGWKQ